MDQIGEVLFNLFAPLLVAGAIGFIAIGLGAQLIGPFLRGDKPPLVESFALGTLVISLLTLFWGVMGWMGLYARWSLALPCALLGILGWIQAKPGWGLNPASFKNRTILVLSLLLVVGIFLRIFLSPLFPPVSSDECSTYLPAATALLESGRITFHADIAFNSFPQNVEMLYAWAAAYTPLSTAHYVNFLAFLFSMLALIRIGRTVFSVKTGWLAALIMASMGTLQTFGATASPDIWVLFYITAAIMVLVEGIKFGAAGRIMLGGILLGAAAGVSYTSLLASLTLAIALSAIGRKLPGTKSIPRWAYFSAFFLFLLVSLPWYVRNIIWFNNPFFPFYETLFPPGGGIYGVYGPECTVRTGWILGTETANMFFQRGVLWPEVLAMWSTWIVVPAGIWFWRSSPFVRAALTWTLLVWGFWMIGGGGIMHFPYYIYLVPVNVLVLAHFLGAVYSLPSGDQRGRFLRVILWALVIGWVGIMGARTSQLIPPLTTDQQTISLNRIHGSYGLMYAANRAIAEDRKAVGILCEDGRLYADFKLLGGSNVGWANHRVISDSCTSPGALANLLNDRYSADYLIVHEERLWNDNSAVFAPIKGLMRSSEFGRYFKEVTRVGEGVVYFVESGE